MYEITATVYTKTIGWFADVKTHIDATDDNPHGYVQDLHDAAIMEGWSTCLSENHARAVFADNQNRVIVAFNPFA